MIQIFNTNYLFLLLLLEHNLIGSDCFTVSLKKEKRPDKDVITYHLTDPRQPLPYRPWRDSRGPSPYLPWENFTHPENRIQENCPSKSGSKLDIPEIEKSNDN